MPTMPLHICALPTNVKCRRHGMDRSVMDQGPVMMRVRVEEV